MEHRHGLAPRRKRGKACLVQHRTLPVGERIDGEVVGSHGLRRTAARGDGRSLGAAAEEPARKLDELGVANEVGDVAPEVVIRAAQGCGETPCRASSDGGRPRDSRRRRTAGRMWAQRLASRRSRADCASISEADCRAGSAVERGADAARVIVDERRRARGEAAQRIGIGHEKRRELGGAVDAKAAQLASGALARSRAARNARA